MRWILLKPSEDLSPSEKERLAPVLEKYPEVRCLVERRDEFRALLDDPAIVSPEMGKVAKVRTFGSLALNKFCDTVTRWIDPISRYFLSRANNGRTEGFNRGIRMIVSRAFGLPAFDHLRLRVLGVFG
jgi:transposase